MMFQKVSASMWRLVLNSLKEHSKPSEGTLKIDEVGHYLAIFDHFTLFWGTLTFPLPEQRKNKKHLFGQNNSPKPTNHLKNNVWPSLAPSPVLLASQLCGWSVPPQTLSLSDGGANKKYLQSFASLLLHLSV